LSLDAGLGGVKLSRLLARFGSPAGILAASEAALCATPRIGPQTAGAIRRARPERAEALLRSLEREGIAALTWEDAGYPAALRALPDAPPVLFARGALTPADDLAVAIVGTRNLSARGRRAAAEIAAALAQRGLTVVSGLALGIDRAAHAGALDAGGRSLAVLGSGIRRLHPLAHVELAARIAGAGAILSEWHPDAVPAPGRLAARNRVISGLSRWTLVIESGAAGGSMHTAGFARRQGRVLAALPGSPGCDALLAAGALRLDWPGLDYDALAERIRQTDSAGRAAATLTAEQLRLLESRPRYG
jgi:DNA processing protein